MKKLVVLIALAIMAHGHAAQKSNTEKLIERLQEDGVLALRATGEDCEMWIEYLNADEAYFDVSFIKDGHEDVYLRVPAREINMGEQGGNSSKGLAPNRLSVANLKLDSLGNPTNALLFTKSRIGNSKALIDERLSCEFSEWRILK